MIVRPGTMAACTARNSMIDEATIDAVAHFTSTASRLGQLNAVERLADALAQSREQR